MQRYRHTSSSRRGTLLSIPRIHQVTMPLRGRRKSPVHTPKVKRLALVVLLAVWGFGVFAAHAQVSYEAGVIAKAKQEGEVVFYASMNLNDAEALKAKFQEKYPFIRVEL